MLKQQLQALGNNHAGVIKMKDGSSRNYGSKRVEDWNFVYYTGKGLREMWHPNGQVTDEVKRLRSLDEQSLIKSGHLAITPISEIAAIEH